MIKFGQSAAKSWPPSTWLTLLLLACWTLAATARAPNENSFGLSLGEMLERSGLQSQATDLTEEQLELVKQMSDVYASDDELEEKERALIEAAGLGAPNAVDKNTLKAISNRHLVNSIKLDKLVAKLAATVERSGNKS